MEKNYSEMEIYKSGDFTEKTIEKDYVFKGKIINVRHDIISLPNGVEATRECVEHRGGVAVLAVDENGMVPLVRQFRYPLGMHLWEIPAGKLEVGEDPFDAINRELKEEAGLVAKDVTLLTAYYPTVGYSSEIIRIYLASGLTFVGANPDEDEFLEIKYFNIEEIKKMVFSGEIKDGKTMTAILYYLSKK